MDRLSLIANRDAEASHKPKPNQSKRTLWLGVRRGKEAASVLSASSRPVPPSQTNVHFLRQYLVVVISRQLHSYLPHTSHLLNTANHEHQGSGARDICQTTLFRVSFWVNGRGRKMADNCKKVMKCSCNAAVICQTLTSTWSLKTIHVQKSLWLKMQACQLQAI